MITLVTRAARIGLAAGAVLAAWIPTALALAGSSGAAAAGLAARPAALAAPCTLFPRDDVWHADISHLPVNRRSAAWLASSAAGTTRLHPDFGPSDDPAHPYGIPVTTVKAGHPLVRPRFDYASESDRVGYPLGRDTRIETGSDQHAVILDLSHCRLFETYATQHGPTGWTAGSGATWDLRSNRLRPNGWTSADAAGLPILPGLLRLAEVRSGHVDHAVRMTVVRTDRSHLWPARHDAGEASDHSLPPMAARFRLRASYPMTGLRPDTRAVLTALKTYGAIVADNGSNWYVGGAADQGWPEGLLDQLKAVPASAFEAVDESSLEAAPNSGQVRAHR